MIARFDWFNSSANSDTDKQEVEDIIRHDIECRIDSEFKPCHVGDVTVRLGIVGPLHSLLEGSITCICGTRYYLFSGPSDASKVAYDRVV